MSANNKTIHIGVIGSTHIISQGDNNGTKPSGFLNLAIDESYKNKQGEWVQKVTWISYYVNSNLITSGAVAKGSIVSVMGRVSIKKDAATNKTTTHLILEDFKMLKKGGGAMPTDQQMQNASNNNARPKKPTAPPADFNVAEDDDLPF